MTEGASFVTRKYEPPVSSGSQEKKPPKGAKAERAPKPKRALEPTDDQIAEAFAEEHRSDLRFVAAWGKWFEWRAGCWREEKTLRTFDLIRKTCRTQGIERAGMAKMVGAVQALVRADRRLAATIEQWDADPMLLNTPDGVIDLRNGELRQHRPEDYQTMIATAGPRGDCPKWKAFLHAGRSR
jgi:putative DNA primase/helicase